MATSIYQKLSNIQQELIAPKGQRNDFGKYNYRSCEDIIQALKPLCDKNKCVVYITNQLISVLDRVYVEARVTLIDLESDGVIVSTAQAREEDDKKGMDGSQITGASSSYARKYALAGLFMIDNEKDSDATNDGKKEEKKEEKKNKQDIAPANANLITPEQRTQILHELNRTKVTTEQVCKMCKVNTIDDIPTAYFDYIIKKLKATPDWEEK